MVFDVEDLDYISLVLIFLILECIVVFFYLVFGEKDNVYRVKCVKFIREKICKVWVGRYYININYNISMIVLLFVVFCMRFVSF